ncbi:flagellar hook-length control protein FliK [Defluviimonas sp. WL0024]|uniref:Flagellar hook-length control protein FliK n=1 Tax=Albidovulum salinarum TaxID=2984153 RepID=A0ABT2X7P1_9RHOB|nr:flagellar hook-length control protein FliK [Defluviimonas sp. WL0024]MCU9849959.1 flagellar hook-length control protein FliK [Defluviimonas sp. WL0024]
MTTAAPVPRSGNAAEIGTPAATAAEKTAPPSRTATPAEAAAPTPVGDLSGPNPSDSAFGERVSDLAAHAAQDPAQGGRAADRAAPAGPVAMHLPPGLGHRLADAITNFPDGAVELTLSPEELGRVRISMSSQDGALTLNVQADRPETVELLRRHIDILAQDFRELGFSNLAFSFGHGQDRPVATQRDSEGDPADLEAESASAAHRAEATGISSRQSDAGGLDLRL